MNGARGAETKVATSGLWDVEKSGNNADDVVASESCTATPPRTVRPRRRTSH